MVQSLAISVGNANSYVAAGQGGGVEILLNEYSNRSTPSMVGFSNQCRAIGTEASMNLFMNLKNTIFDIMLLVGKPYESIDWTKYPFKVEQDDETKKPVVVVTHLGKERKFSITQILAMLFTKLRGIANQSTDCVISCPQFFDDEQKLEVLEAAVIAGLKPLEILSDMSAVALNYAYYRTTREDKPKLIAFIDFGQSNLQVLIASIHPAEDVVKVLATDSELIGGKDFDRLLADHFIREHNLKLNQKSYLKLVTACEKLKLQLSSIATTIPVNVESLISENEDFCGRIDRAKFEELSKPLLEQLEACLARCLAKAKDEIEKEEGATFKLEVVELVGGSTRIPAVKQIIQQVSELGPSTTLNIDEAVARGCLIHCATLHPGVKINRIIKIQGAESFHKTKDVSKKLIDIELDLIEADSRHVSRTVARNNLEEFIYSERSANQEGDKFLEPLNQALDWLFSDEGEDAQEDEYLTRLTELRQTKKRILEPPKPMETDTPKPETPPKPSAGSPAVEQQDAPAQTA